MCQAALAQGVFSFSTAFEVHFQNPINYAFTLIYLLNFDFIKADMINVENRSKEKFVLNR